MTVRKCLYCSVPDEAEFPSLYKPEAFGVRDAKGSSWWHTPASLAQAGLFQNKSINEFGWSKESVVLFHGQDHHHTEVI